MKKRIVAILCLLTVICSTTGLAENLFLQDFIDAEVNKKGKLFGYWSIEEQYYFINELREMAKDYAGALPPGVETKLQHLYGLPEDHQIRQEAALDIAQAYIIEQKLVDPNQIAKVKTYFYVDNPEIPVWHFSFCDQHHSRLFDVQVCPTTGHVLNVLWAEKPQNNTYWLYRKQIDAKYSHFYEASLEEKAMLDKLLVISGGTPAAAFRAGLPGEDDLTQEEAEQLARVYISKKYALSDTTLSALNAYFDFNVVDPVNPVWNVYFYYAGDDLESYTVYLNAKTGEVIKSYGPDEGNG
ncbi:MAG: PepSY domain-containing protein [Clostridia bacterium]|nr:PepSY domain-containing protein [Clostridia bacterium]